MPSGHDAQTIEALTQLQGLVAQVRQQNSLILQQLEQRFQALQQQTQPGALGPDQAQSGQRKWLSPRDVIHSNPSTAADNQSRPTPKWPSPRDVVQSQANSNSSATGGPGTGSAPSAENNVSIHSVGTSGSSSSVRTGTGANNFTFTVTGPDGSTSAPQNATYMVTSPSGNNLLPPPIPRTPRPPPPPPPSSSPSPGSLGPGPGHGGPGGNNTTGYYSPPPINQPHPPFYRAPVATSSPNSPCPHPHHHHHHHTGCCKRTCGGQTDLSVCSPISHEGTGPRNCQTCSNGGASIASGASGGESSNHTQPYKGFQILVCPECNSKIGKKI